jgi:hypothetical protein
MASLTATGLPSWPAGAARVVLDDEPVAEYFATLPLPVTTLQSPLALDSVSMVAVTLSLQSDPRDIAAVWRLPANTSKTLSSAKSGLLFEMTVQSRGGIGFPR